MLVSVTDNSVLSFLFSGCDLHSQIVYLTVLACYVLQILNAHSVFVIDVHSQMELMAIEYKVQDWNSSGDKNTAKILGKVHYVTYIHQVGVDGNRIQSPGLEQHWWQKHG